MVSWPLISDSAFTFIQGRDVTKIIQSDSQGQSGVLLPPTAPVGDDESPATMLVPPVLLVSVPGRPWARRTEAMGKFFLTR